MGFDKVGDYHTVLEDENYRLEHVTTVEHLGGLIDKIIKKDKKIEGIAVIPSDVINSRDKCTPLWKYHNKFGIYIKRRKEEVKFQK